MKEVSEAYKQAVIAPELYTRMTGTIKTSITTYEISDKNIIPGSLFISRKAINQSSFEYGAAVTSEMSISVLLDTDRYTMYGGIIELWLHTRLADETEEILKLGTWNVNECTKTRKILQFKCYDNMLLFDIDITDDTTGSVYELLNYACDKCGVELAQTEEEVQALVNGNIQFRVQADNFGTYRDLICYIGMVTCTFARIDENGKLVMQCFGKEPARELIKRQVLSSTISDFKSSYRSVTARFIADTNYAPYEVADGELSGLVLDMGDIPIVRGLIETKYQVLTNVLNDLKGIIYTPVELSIISDPSIEPGDMLTVKNANQTDDDIVTLITSTTWTFHGQMRLTSAGSNPKLATAKDKSTKQIECMENSIEDKSVIILSYTNAEEYEVKQTLVDVAEISYTTYENSKPIFLMTVNFSIDVDGFVEFDLYNGLVAIPHASYSGYYLAGEHFVTIFYPDNTEENERRNLRVLTRAYKNKNSIIRQQAADIATLNNAIEAIKISNDLNSLTYDTVAPDETEPTVTIAAQAIKAIIYAQGISTKAEWDGDLEFTDQFDQIRLSNIMAGMFSASVGANIDTPVPSGFTDAMSAINLASIAFETFEDSVGINSVITNYIVNTAKAALYTFDAGYVLTDTAYQLNTTYSYIGTEHMIDDGSMTGVEIDLTQFKSVTSIEIGVK